MGCGGNERLQRRWPYHLGVLLVYGLLALALTYPLVSHLGSHVPGNGVDDPPLTWNLWWVPTALLELGTNPFQCDYLFYPLGINLSFYTLTVLNGLLSIPLQAVLSLVTSSNLLLLSSFVLGGYGAFLLALAVVPRGEGIAGHLPAFAAGLMYAFSSSKLFYAALGQWNIASSQWIPFYLLVLVRMAQRPQGLRLPLLGGLFLLFQAYAELTYASFLVLFTGLWLAWHLLVPPGHVPAGALRRRHGARLLLGTGLVALVFLVGMVPQLAAMLPDMRAEGDIWSQGGGFADVFSADLLGFFLPTALHPVLGGLGERLSFHRSAGQQIYPGYLVLGLAVLGAVAWRRRPQARFWAVSALAFWLLTLGPTLQFNGQDTGLPLPFALIEQLPFFQGNRYPSRYSVMLTLSLALLAAMGVAWLGRWLAGRWKHAAESGKGPLPGVRGLASGGTFLLLAAALLFEHLSAPLPLSDMAVPPAYRAVAEAMPGDFALLDLPLAWRNGARVTGTQDPLIMFAQYYQSAHGKRLLAGNTSRNPRIKFQYFAEAPVIDTLIALETGHGVEPAVVEADAALAPQVLRFFDVQAIVVHPEVVGPEMNPYLEAILPLETLYRDDETVAYRVALPAWPESWTALASDPLGGLSFVEGWSPPAGDVAWAQRRSVRLLVPSQGGPVRLTFRAYAPGEGQRLRVEAGGQGLPWLPLSPGWHDYELELVLAQGLNEVWLHFQALYPAAGTRLTGASRAIGTTGVESPVSIVVTSAGQEVGDLAEIHVQGRDVSPDGRGYNLAVIDPTNGSVEATASLDTHLDEGASAALAAFLAQVPAGHIVAVAAADEASRLLGTDAVEALRGLGAGGDLRDRFRWGHAFVGVQGAAPGTAAEAMDWKRPVRVVVGEGATEPYLAAAFGPLTFTAVAGTP
jgi:hypothetical protein